MSTIIPNNTLFTSHRKRLIQNLEPNSIVILSAASRLPRNGDTYFPYRQDSNFYYLTGINEPDCFLILFPDHPNTRIQEILFIPEISAQGALWDGESINRNTATELSGIENIRFTNSFHEVLNDLLKTASKAFLAYNEKLSFTSQTDSNLALANTLKQRYPLYNFQRLNPIIDSLRRVKSDQEIQLMKEAISITGLAFERVLKTLKPGITESHIEAEITHEFLTHSIKHHAYHPIIATGKNSCTLHYHANTDICKSGDVVLMDFGAEYNNYAADVSRTIPVSGAFNKRQKSVYQSVLNIQKKAKQILRPGITLRTYEQTLIPEIEAELIHLNLLQEKNIQKENPLQPIYRTFYPHSTSHYLGLDVHDVGVYDTPLEPGVVISCEPGIYIPEEGFGIRLENDILITKDGCLDLTENIPIEIEEIESLMKQQ
jgi:Xaa-Pro aminopeptidase